MNDCPTNVPAPTATDLYRDAERDLVCYVEGEHDTPAERVLTLALGAWIRRAAHAEARARELDAALRGVCNACDYEDLAEATVRARAVLEEEKNP